MTSTTALATGLARQRLLSASYAERLRQSCVCRAALAGVGVSNTTRSQDPAVGVFFDGLYVGLGPGSVAAAVDFESVERRTHRAVCGGVPRTYGVALRADF